MIQIPSKQKVCKLCCLEIPYAARKCPHCHHFQDRWSLIVFHPAIAAIAFSLPMLISLAFVRSSMDPGESYDGRVRVTETQVTFGVTRSGPTVAVIGTLINAGRVPWKEIRFQVDFQDPAGRRTDVGVEVDHELQLPPGETSSFKLSFPREFPETNYATATVRIVGAKDATARW